MMRDFTLDPVTEHALRQIIREEIAMDEMRSGKNLPPHQQSGDLGGQPAASGMTTFVMPEAGFLAEKAKEWFGIDMAKGEQA